VSKLAKKNDLNTIASLLDNLLAKEIEYVPYKKDNTVYIHNFRIVKKTKFVYLVYRDKELISNCFYKKSAFAVVQRILNKQDFDDVINHDSCLEKNYNDSLFYLNTISNTDSSIKFNIASVRLDISKDQIAHHAHAIDEAARWQ
tara:strand:- start:645 stop:1076 length:432 start_codon:yes stop_codon:yes gene_type:complete